MDHGRLGKVAFLLTAADSVIAATIRQRGFAAYTILTAPPRRAGRLRRLHLAGRLPLKAIWFDLTRLRDDPADTFVIVDSPEVEALSRQVRRARPDARVIVWYWNLARRTPGPWDPGIEVCTFDPGDAEKFGMRLTTPFFFREFTGLSHPAKDRDVIFVGRDKGRADQIEALHLEMSRAGLVTDFHVVADRSPQQVPYRTILERTSRSRAVLDVVQSGQRGLTLRALEALFLGSGLITNNPQVRLDATYPDANVFLLGVDDFADLPAFVRRHDGQIDQAAVEYYDFDAWLGRLLEVG